MEYQHLGCLAPRECYCVTVHTR